MLDIVHPDYYASGYNLMVPKTVKITSWSQLKGVPVCAIQGAFYNKEVAEKYGAETVAFTGVAEALTALQQGRCNAFLYDDTAIEGKLQDPAWKGYDMPLAVPGCQALGHCGEAGRDQLGRFLSRKPSSIGIRPAISWRWKPNTAFRIRLSPCRCTTNINK